MEIFIASSILWTVICAVVASNKHRSVGGWAIGGLVFGVFALLFLAFQPKLLPPNNPQQTMVGMGPYQQGHRPY